MKPIENKEKISHIYSEFSMCGYEMEMISDETLDKIIKNRLIGELYNSIINNTDELPIEYTTNYEMVKDVMNHRAEMIIIDKEELNRLKEIEWKYNNLCR